MRSQGGGEWGNQGFPRFLGAAVTGWRVAEVLVAGAEERPLQPAAHRRAGHRVEQQPERDPCHEQAGVAPRVAGAALALNPVRGGPQLVDRPAQVVLDLLVACDLLRQTADAATAC